MNLPWHTSQWKQLWYAKQENKLAHALLFSGISGTGKTQFADRFIRSLLCQKNISELACGDCHSCRLITGKVHPDVLWIEPGKEGQAIKIDQIRDIAEFIYQTSFLGEYRIVIINPAHQMNANAANALLKMLEEPPSASIIILITEQLSHLPATILSRCQRFLFPIPSFAYSLPWLQEQLREIKQPEKLDPVFLLRLVKGAPFTAIQWVKSDMISVRVALYQKIYALTQQAANLLQIAEYAAEINTLFFLDCMLTWELDVLRLQWGVDEIINVDFIRELLEVKNKRHGLSTTFLSYLQKLRVQISKGININKQLLIENVLIHYSFTLHTRAPSFIG